MMAGCLVNNFLRLNNRGYRAGPWELKSEEADEAAVRKDFGAGMKQTSCVKGEASAHQGFGASELRSLLRSNSENKYAHRYPLFEYGSRGAVNKGSWEHWVEEVTQDIEGTSI
ncbi:uncharacterized protein BDCG_03084 [Blastomyces dermatitidis ER-3]|uniref:Uncharacterized protein n=1 Tax=Ajellomyces dermatitidis (strain ER-3 / ATCC MYA-2586) TaxID=559297 RepID=A0ABP2EXI2_AJEDR|nr:uncharacterized protein BDCG_03084 [Blastomyces dermatitidis ER-3]EEQ87964.2 hypothetical protein BDCG_03084 [Blastomyces dermatitidis ER-3]